MAQEIPALGAEQLERALNASMARAQKDKNSKLDITADEAANLRKAFQKPEFRSLFNDYLQEISDPANKKEYDQYLDSLERQGKVPDHVNLVRPEAGFCVKVKTLGSESRKVFINVCSSSTVDVPSVKKVSQGGRSGQSWRLPHIVGPQRVEQDKKGTACETFDVCFHTDALRMSQTNSAFKDMLARTAVEGVVKAVHKVRQSNEFQVDIEKYHILVGRSCMGDKPAALNVPKDDKKQKVESLAAASQASGGVRPASTENSKHSAANGPKTKDVKNKRTEQAWSKKGFLNKGKRDNNDKTKNETKTEGSGIKELSADESKKKNKTKKLNADGTLQPNYKVIHRGKLELANYMTDLTNAPASTRPKDLVYTVSLPALSSAKRVELDVSETHLKIRVPKIYALCVQLPFPVQDELGKAKFDKSKRELIITLPVQRPIVTREEVESARNSIVKKNPPKNHDPDPGNEAKENNESGDDEDNDMPDLPATTDTVVEDDFVLVESPRSAALKKNNPHLDNGVRDKQLKDHQNLTQEISRRAAEAVAAEKLRQATLPQSVNNYVCKQTASSVTVLVPLENVDQNSAKFDIQDQSITASFTLKAESTDSAARNYLLKLQLAGNIVPANVRSSVSTKNVVIILPKATAGIWDQIEKDTATQITENEDHREAKAVSVAPEQRFIAAKSWEGRRPGFVFCNGVKGMGYYWDTGPFQHIDNQFDNNDSDTKDNSSVADTQVNDEKGIDEGKLDSETQTTDRSKEQNEQLATESPSDNDQDEDQGNINVFENNFVFELD